jgi:hypothetical protein
VEGNTQKKNLKGNGYFIKRMEHYDRNEISKIMKKI